MNAHNKLMNGFALISVFGSWPSFHDAEVVWLHLDRRATDLGDVPTIEAVIQITSERLDTGTVTHDLVHLRFARVVELKLDGSDGLDLYGLGIKDATARQFDVNFYSTWGIGTSFGCQNVEVVSVQPCENNGTPICS
jgi:hypothetical protein